VLPSTSTSALASMTTISSAACANALRGCRQCFTPDPVPGLTDEAPLARSLRSRGTGLEAGLLRHQTPPPRLTRISSIRAEARNSSDFRKPAPMTRSAAPIEREFPWRAEGEKGDDRNRLRVESSNPGQSPAPPISLARGSLWGLHWGDTELVLDSWTERRLNLGRCVLYVGNRRAFPALIFQLPEVPQDGL
jgi:hypothetical protein